MSDPDSPLPTALVSALADRHVIDRLIGEGGMATVYLAHSTPERFLFSATDFNSYGTVAFADGSPQRKHGRLAASREPGLGVRPIMDVLGAPLQSWG